MVHADSLRGSVGDGQAQELVLVGTASEEGMKTQSFCTGDGLEAV